ncbi:MAG: imidazole glycerol phosphate synthase subunit HisF [Bacteroidales bacterium]|nr:imidazole glycerol phosphate synthase subunit HisF [Bacteroidales bacterium]
MLLREDSLVKTVQFKKFSYIGDPSNTCRIFNELEVDELTFLDITASRDNKAPNYRVLQEIANQCFMPLSYGGGVRSVQMAEHIFEIGFEKIVINSYPFENPEIITELANAFGSQSVIIAIDYRRNFWGQYQVYSMSGMVNQKISPVKWAKEVQDRGAGEILLTSIDREGTWKGFDIDCTAQVVSAVSIPVIANGGAGNVQDIGEVINNAHVSAVALGSMVVYQKKGLGVLVNFPDKEDLRGLLEGNNEK